jgi:hypothetical protein
MGYNYAARLCLAAVIDIQHGEIVGWEVESGYKLWLIRKTLKPKKRKKRLRGFFSRIKSCLGSQGYDRHAYTIIVSIEIA